MQFTPSHKDQAFRADFEAGAIAPAAFTHRAHLRLAYVYLCESDVSLAHDKMKAALLAFLARNGVDATKFHETITHAWIKAVRYFMNKAGRTTSFDAFLRKDDRLLDTDIMLSHYSRETLFSDAARIAFVAPDRSAIPEA